MKVVKKEAHIGLMVKQRRKGLKISQERLGEMIGVSYQQVQKYESGRDRVSAEKLRDIASALNIDINYFYEPVSSEEAHEETKYYGNMKGLSPDEKELVKSFRAIDDMEFRRHFLTLLMCAAKGFN